MKQYIIKPRCRGHVCSVPGCLSRETRAVALVTGDHGCIHLCDDCIAAAAAAAGIAPAGKGKKKDEGKKE